ncbi:MAG: YicC/YloC family endoribonuclease [Pseudomonadota bacterium]
MIRSMTAYAAQSSDTPRGTLSWELRTVNHRYLDASLRMPEDFRALEPDIRQQLKARLHRGKVEANFRFQPDAAAASAEIKLNPELAKALLGAHGELAALNGADAAQPDLVRLLSWPGVVVTERPDLENERGLALTLLDQAIDALIAAREQEGQALAEMIEARLVGIEAQVTEVRAHLPAIREALDNRFRERLEGLKQPIEPGRIEQEVVLQLQKLDVDEELDRLDAHVAEIRRVLTLEEPVGRRLDFLMQELNREANTLGSKAALAETGQAAVELKVLIEQMREQIQNVE